VTFEKLISSAGAQMYSNSKSSSGPEEKKSHPARKTSRLLRHGRGLRQESKREKTCQGQQNSTAEHTGDVQVHTKKPGVMDR
jgi:hypothetical protein